MDVTSESGFLEAFIEKGRESGLKEHFQGMEFTAGKVMIENPGKNEEPASLTKVLDTVVDRMKPFSPMPGVPPCVLVIDEANEFKKLVRQEPKV